MYKHRPFSILFCILFLALAGGSFAGIENAIVTDIPKDQQLERFGAIAGSALTDADKAAIASQKVTGPEIRLLVVPVKWIDRGNWFSREQIDSMIFSSGPGDHGSVVEYISEVSYGQATVTGEVIDWIDAGMYDQYFNFESLLPQIDAIVDFSQFDGNNDGVVDAVTFVRSGFGREDSHNYIDIWSYAMIYGMGSGPGPYDGKMISRWNTCPEGKPVHDPNWPPDFIPGAELNSIRVFCHELSHNLGLPDLYDYDDKLVFDTYHTPNDGNDHPVYDWDIMGYGGYGYFSLKGNNPSHPCGWSKMAMDWITPTLIPAGDHEIVLENIATTPVNSLYQIYLTEDSSEYFLLEYRNPHSAAQFDKTDSDFSTWFPTDMELGFDTLDQGLLVLHVDESVSGYWDNDGWPAHDHYRVAVEDAGYNPARDVYTNPEGGPSDTAQWWYPWETRKGACFSDDVSGQEEFSASTVPNTESYNNGPTGVSIRVDSIKGEFLYASVHNPLTFDEDSDGVTDDNDNCPGTPNPLQTNSDGDTVGDACDNCPTTDNQDQADQDSDTVGDACDNCPAYANTDQTDTDADLIGDVCDWCCFGMTGNVNMDPQGVRDLSDILDLASYAFLGGTAPACRATGNVSGDIECVIDLADILDLASYAFLGGSNPADCMPECHIPGE